jgi:hypothetical protein
MKELVIYQGSNIPPQNGDQYMHNPDDWYYAPDTWSIRCPYSQPYPTEEAARAAADEYAARKEWF